MGDRFGGILFCARPPYLTYAVRRLLSSSVVLVLLVLVDWIPIPENASRGLADGAGGRFVSR